MAKRKLTKEHLEKLKKGRQQRLEKNGLVCKIGDRVEVWADDRQYILKVKGRSDTYFPALDMLLGELFESKIRELSTQQNRKHITDLQLAIAEAMKWFEKNYRSDAIKRGIAHSRAKS